jgi:RND family efflux transporter MFP subunit
VHDPNPRHATVNPADGDAAFDAFDEEAQVAGVSTDDAEQPHDQHGHVPVATAYARGTGRRLGLFVAVLAAALVAGFFVVQRLKHGDESALRDEAAMRVQEVPPVEVVKAQIAPPIERLVLPGETRGWYTSTIYARVTGYVAEWRVDIGDRVKKDQVMAIVDTPDLDAQLDAARAQLEAAEADAKVKESDADFARTTWVRWETSAKGLVSEQDRDDKKAHYQSSLAQLNAARARINLDRANVDRLTFLTRFKDVTAPYDGVITERRIDIGDLVTAGSTNTTPLFGIAQSERIRTFVDVPQSARIDLGIGQTAKVTAAELPNRVFEGTVTRTSEAADPRARTVRVEIDLNNDDGALVPGLYVQVAFNLPPRSAVQVPAGAMIFRGSGPQVALITDGDAVKFQDVSIARDNGKFVEIASGLSEGDRVVINISNQIVDGEKVAVREIADDVPKATK